MTQWSVNWIKILSGLLLCSRSGYLNPEKMNSSISLALIDIIHYFKSWAEWQNLIVSWWYCRMFYTRIRRKLIVQIVRRRKDIWTINRWGTGAISINLKPYFRKFFMYSYFPSILLPLLDPNNSEQIYFKQAKIMADC